MASLNTVEMDLPNGDSFHATGNIAYRTTITPTYLIDGRGGGIIAAISEVKGGDSYTEQVYEGAGAKVRTFNIDLTTWEGDTNTWGSASAGDDITTKFDVFEESLASQRITSSKTATLSFGEFSSSGQFSSHAVVPGEIELPRELGEQPSSGRARVQWFDALDLDQALHTEP